MMIARDCLGVISTEYRFELVIDGHVPKWMVSGSANAQQTRSNGKDGAEWVGRWVDGW